MTDDRIVTLQPPFIAQVRNWREEDYRFHTELALGVTEEAEEVRVDVNVDLLPPDRTLTVVMGGNVIYTGKPEDDKTATDALRAIILDLHTLECAGVHSIPINLIRKHMEGLYLD